MGNGEKREESDSKIRSLLYILRSKMKDMLFIKWSWTLPTFSKKNEKEEENDKSNR